MRRVKCIVIREFERGVLSGDINLMIGALDNSISTEIPMYYPFEIFKDLRHDTIRFIKPMVLELTSHVIYDTRNHKIINQYNIANIDVLRLYKEEVNKVYNYNFE